ncbi:MAG: 2-amino-4-hydroxy-6-hydroxymethyldihydropteridine diphosphokinase, partial [Anaerolineae bacterium]|nr:2-amino-4-hydroxy-6-hydroxymethyldihydropteridine diphosphokinase [Anaerolineae bacterium]
MKHLTTTVALGLGSNIGDRTTFLRQAVAAIRSDHILKHVRCSSLYQSEALLKADAPDAWNQPFLNMAIVGETSLPPEALLTALQRIEQALGKRKRGIWAPREIDIDILLYGKERIALPHLTVPHPGVPDRAFVLVPLAEIARD